MDAWHKQFGCVLPQKEPDGTNWQIDYWSPLLNQHWAIEWSAALQGPWSSAGRASTSTLLCGMLAHRLRWSQRAQTNSKPHRLYRKAPALVTIIIRAGIRSTPPCKYKASITWHFNASWNYLNRLNTNQWRNAGTVRHLFHFARIRRGEGYVYVDLRRITPKRRNCVTSSIWYCNIDGQYGG